MIGSPIPKTLTWIACYKEYRERVIRNDDRLDDCIFYALADDVKPKTVEAREWDAYVDGDGNLRSIHEVRNTIVNSNIPWVVKPIRVREVIDTQKEPKERREYLGWVNGSDFFQHDDEFHNGSDLIKKGWRLATLVEKGGGE